MSIDYTEKRNYIRMKTDSKITFRTHDSQHTHEGQCVDLSAAGVCFTCDQHIKPGTRVDINITPSYSVVKPLDATIVVVRAQANSDGRFAIAGEIKTFG